MKNDILIANILSIYGDQGQQWLDNIPQFVRDFSARWGLRALQPLSNLTHHYVFSGFQGEGDRPIILKLGHDEESLKKEAFALRCFCPMSSPTRHDTHNKGGTAVKVLAEDTGALLLERVVPSRSLKDCFPDQDRKAVEIACHVMKDLHTAASIPHHHTFPFINQWLATLDKNWELPSLYLEKARTLRDHLLGREASVVLLHGDLHWDNILQQKEQDDAHPSEKTKEKWRVIDPKGVVGSPIHETWAFVLTLERDIPFIADFFSFNTQDLFDWYFVHLMRAVCWNLEDHIPPDFFFDLAQKAYPYTS